MKLRTAARLCSSQARKDRNREDGNLDQLWSETTREDSDLSSAMC